MDVRQFISLKTLYKENSIDNQCFKKHDTKQNTNFQVGLPARGKTYISKKLSRYLNWIGINTKVKGRKM